MTDSRSHVLEREEHFADTHTPNPSQSVGYQSWNEDNLCVDSYHEDIHYYTSRWDGLCPYVDVTPEMLAMAKKPFIVYAIPPESAYGVPINDKYGLVNVADPDFWTEPRRQRKFKELEKLCRSLRVTETVIAGSALSFDDIYEMGGVHFENYYIHTDEVEGFIDYIKDLDVLVIRAFAENGDLVLTDVSVLLPERKQVYGSFCQWNPEYKKYSPGIFACLLASKWAAANGYRHYNLGPVDDYGYKALFVTEFEPIFAVAVTDPQHPLALDTTSPLHTDFTPAVWNQIHRPAAKSN
jgi:Acetyltransferase (GNAT) domain